MHKISDVPPLVVIMRIYTRNLRAEACVRAYLRATLEWNLKFKEIRVLFTQQSSIDAQTT